MRFWKICASGTSLRPRPIPTTAVLFRSWSKWTVPGSGSEPARGIRRGPEPSAPPPGNGGRCSGAGETPAAAQAGTVLSAATRADQLVSVSLARLWRTLQYLANESSTDCSRRSWTTSPPVAVNSRRRLTKRLG